MISHSVKALLLLTTLVLSHTFVDESFVALAHSLLVSKDPPEKLFRVELVIRVFISLLEHAEDFINDELIIGVCVKEVEQTVVTHYLRWLLISDDLGLEGTVEAGFPANERHFLETFNVVPISSVVKSGTVFIAIFVTGLILLLVPGEVVGASVVHPLVLSLLPDVVHTDPVRVCVANQPSDKFILKIVVNGNKVTSPFHADELSRPPVIGSSFNFDDVLIFFALIL